MRIQVTKEDILHGTRCNERYCPVARAITRVLKPEVHVKVGHDFIVLCKWDFVENDFVDVWRDETTAGVKCFIRSFDDVLSEDVLRPFEFEFTVPEGYLAKRD